MYFKPTGKGRAPCPAGPKGAAAGCSQNNTPGLWAEAEQKQNIFRQKEHRRGRFAFAPGTSGPAGTGPRPASRPPPPGPGPVPAPRPESPAGPCPSPSPPQAPGPRGGPEPPHQPRPYPPTPRSRRAARAAPERRRPRAGLEGEAEARGRALTWPRRRSGSGGRAVLREKRPRREPPPRRGGPGWRGPAPRRGEAGPRPLGRACSRPAVGSSGCRGSPRGEAMVIKENIEALRARGCLGGRQQGGLSRSGEAVCPLLRGGPRHRKISLNFSSFAAEDACWLQGR